MKPESDFLHDTDVYVIHALKGYEYQGARVEQLLTKLGIGFESTEYRPPMARPAAHPIHRQLLFDCNTAQPNSGPLLEICHDL